MSVEPSELDDLLDNALEDFDNLPKPRSKSKSSSAPTSNNPCPTEEDFMAIFKAAGLGQTGELPDHPSGGLKEELEKLAKLAVEAENENSSCENVDERLSETIKQMSKNSAGLSAQPSEEELQAMFANMTMGEGMQSGFDNLIPMMEGMMQSLLSKELLYPAMKDIAEKFPDWLADNRTKLSEEDFNKHNKQYDLTKKICFKFEEEKEDGQESDEIKKARFDQIMSMMQEMQSLGHPPQELTGESSPAFQFDAEGNPILPGVDPNQCCLQ